MKKLLYSAIALFTASVMLISCDSGSGSGNGGGSTPSGPNITFQTNTGTFSGFTFANDKLLIGSTVKIGVVVTSSVNLKNTKMTVKYNSQPEVIIGTDSTFSGSVTSCNRTYNYTLPQDKGTYTFTAYATDKDQTTKTATIVVVAYGPLADKVDGLVYSLKATTPGSYSAYDLFENTAISAASSAGNQASRDIVDASTGSTLSRTWTSQNGTEFIISDATGKLNGKVYSQFQSEQDLIDAWNATSGKSTTVTGIDDGKLLIAKSSRGGVTYYYLIGINTVTDLTGAEDDTYSFQYKQ